jgi:hypothetical protein
VTEQVKVVAQGCDRSLWIRVTVEETRDDGHSAWTRTHEDVRQYAFGRLDVAPDSRCTHDNVLIANRCIGSGILPLRYEPFDIKDRRANGTESLVCIRA